MDYLIASLYFLLCLGLLYRMLRSRDVVDFQLGVIAAFSIGYYCLPVWFKHLTPLRYDDENLVAQAVLIFFLFGLFVVLGTWLGRRIVPHSVAFRTANLDAILMRRRKLLTILGFLFYLYYYTTQELTSYSARDFEVYFIDRGPFSAIIAMFAAVALGWIALSIALAWRDHRRKELLIFSAMMGTCIFLLIFLGQRLALLSPIVILMAALALTRQKKKAFKMFIIGVVTLLLFSPIAVVIRESLADKVVTSAKEAVGSFGYGNAPFMTVFQSILDRGDLIHVAVGMKRRIDADPLPGAIYYASVLLNPIPRALFPGGIKPAPLSTNGLPTGELSVYAWKTLISNSTGSLSAFGGIVAYRELGWGGVLLNGLMTGILFVFVARWLGQGGLLVAVCYINLFVDLSVSKVPPSFWEALYALMPLLPFLAAIYLIEVVLSRSRRPDLSHV